MKSEKIVVLEATRGIAAIVVLLNHLLQAFFPRLDGLTFPDERIALFGTPLFAFVNGTAAVVLFFVLSGFVLTVRAFQSRSSVPLIVGAVRRWPRL
jgi:peptidoglycan/LPS O-acetylase OafA/YrhL